MIMNNSINWFEIPVNDITRARDFYEKIFQQKLIAKELMGYQIMIFPSDYGAVSGALVQGDGYKPSVHGSIVYLNGGPDLQNILNRVINAGGKILVPKTIMDESMGYFAFILDCEGNKIALHSMQ